jgi:hypothetical protein
MSKKNNASNLQFCPMDLGSRNAAALTIIAPTHGTTAVLPARYPLRRAAYSRKKAHLYVQADGFPEIAVPRFFSDCGQTTLATEDGTEISRHMIFLILNLSSRVEKALNAMAVPATD